jgi:glucokinase
MSNLALALDLGGTKIEAALVEANGQLVNGSRTRASMGEQASRNVDVAVGSITNVLRRVMQHSRWPEVAAVGIGSAGPVDSIRGTVSPINLGSLRRFDLVRTVTSVTQLDRAELALDGTCLALAEMWLGAARGARNALVMVVSTGVGGGVISDGRLVGGESGNAGHVGQMLINHEPNQMCTVEEIASGPMTVTWARDHGWKGDTGEDLGIAAAAGEEIAIRAIARSAQALGLGIASAMALLDLDLVLIGGGFSFVAPDYVDMVQIESRKATAVPLAHQVNVRRAGLGGEGPLVGAAGLIHRPDLLASKTSAVSPRTTV